MATVENQDFPVSEGIQRGFYSGASNTFAPNAIEAGAALNGRVIGIERPRQTDQAH